MNYLTRRVVWKSQNSARSREIGRMEKVWQSGVKKHIDGSKTAIKDAMLETNRSVGAKFAKTSANKFGVNKDFDIVMTNHVNENLDKIVDSIKETTTKRAAVIKETNGSISRFVSTRGRLLADIETSRASNAGTLIGAQEAQKVTGKKMSKLWVATLDSLVRSAHDDADGQLVPLKEDFIVDGEALEYPQDSQGSAGNTINCRCISIISEIN